MMEMVTETFKQGAQDYFFLLNRGYPERPAVKLVGDRYRLDGNQRLVLYRGIAPRDKAEAREARITGRLADHTLYVDGYNVFYTVANYFLGKTLFVANDGLVRDCGEVYGRGTDEKVFSHALGLVVEILAAAGPKEVNVFLDQSVQESEDHAGQLERKLALAGIPGQIRVVKSADRELEGITTGIVATSDSEIVDALTGPVADLPRLALESRFQTRMLHLGNLLEEA